MTVDEILTLAREHLSQADRGELAAWLIVELGQPEIPGMFPANASVRGPARWDEQQLVALRKVIAVAMERLKTAPLPFVDDASSYVREVLGRETAN